MYLFRIGKPHFPFRRVHVDVDPMGFDIEKKHKEGHMTFREEGAVPIDDRMLYRAVFDRPAIDEQFLRSAAGARPHRIDDETFHG